MTGTAAAVLLALTSCGGSETPENIVENAISAAEASCPAKDSALLGKAASYNAQCMTALHFADSVYMHKIYEIKDKLESQELSESKLKKYIEEYDALNDAKAQALSEIESHYKTIINEEIDRIFAETPQIDIPVEIDSPWATMYRDAKVFLTRSENGISWTCEVTANPDGYSEGWTINSKMNFLRHPSFYIKEINSEGDCIDSNYTQFDGSETATFTNSAELYEKGMARYADVDHIILKQN